MKTALLTFLMTLIIAVVSARPLSLYPRDEQDCAQSAKCRAAVHACMFTRDDRLVGRGMSPRRVHQMRIRCVGEYVSDFGYEHDANDAVGSVHR